MGVWGRPYSVLTLLFVLFLFVFAYLNRIFDGPASQQMVRTPPPPPAAPARPAPGRQPSRRRGPRLVKRRVFWRRPAAAYARKRQGAGKTLPQDYPRAPAMRARRCTWPGRHGRAPLARWLGLGRGAGQRVRLAGHMVK